MSLLFREYTKNVTVTLPKWGIVFVGIVSPFSSSYSYTTILCYCHSHYHGSAKKDEQPPAFLRNGVRSILEESVWNQAQSVSFFFPRYHITQLVLIFRTWSWCVVICVSIFMIPDKECLTKYFYWWCSGCCGRFFRLGPWTLVRSIFFLIVKIVN